MTFCCAGKVCSKCKETQQFWEERRQIAAKLEEDLSDAEIMAVLEELGNQMKNHFQTAGQ